MNEKFKEFYSLYPRKKSPRDAQKAWLSLTDAQREKALDVIGAHVKIWNAEEREKTFIPYPATWLRSWAFDDELEMPEPKKAKTIEVAWWASEAGMLAKGREFNTAPRLGEDWFQFKSRLIELVNGSKRIG